jgi:hypothetical protein
MLFAAALSLVATHLLASRSTEENQLSSAQKIAQQAMSCLEEEDLPGMFAVLREQLAANDWDLRALENLLRHQRELASTNLGTPVGEVELVRIEPIGKSLVRFTYLEKWERSGMIWRLTLYRPRDGWRLSQLAWDDKPWEAFR